MSNIKTFSFQSNAVQVIDKDGQAWFFASEIATIFGYRDSHNLTRILDADEKDTHQVSTLGGNQAVSIINESGLYHAAFKSRKSMAQDFRRWVTSEVLPSIRKTGQYSTTITPSQQQHLKELVDLVVATGKQTYAETWARLHRKFSVPRYTALPAANRLILSVAGIIALLAILEDDF